METALGAALALLGAVVGTIALEWLTGRRMERHLREERLRKLHGLRAEVAENTVVDTAGSWRKAPFATDAWEEAKSVLAEVEPEVEDVIRHAYVRVRAHNALIEYDRASMEAGRGSLDGDIRRSTHEVAQEMQAALQALDRQLEEGRR
jgi:hypothetical protein